MAFSKIQAAQLYFYRYDDDALVNDINSLKKLDEFVKNEKPQQIYNLGSKRIAFDQMDVNYETFDFELQPSFRVYKNLPARERKRLGIT